MNVRSIGVLCALLGCSRTSAPSTQRASATQGPTQGPSQGPTQGADAVMQVEGAARDSLVSVGQDAPRFRAVAHDGKVIESAGPRARPLVVYFYPRDETPGCTVEAQGFRDAAQEFEAAGVDVVGVSTDSNEAHRAFAANHRLGFSLVSDPEGRLASAFGVRVRMGFAQRITFVIDRSGRISRVFESVTPAGHATEVLAAARAG